MSRAYLKNTKHVAFGEEQNFADKVAMETDEALSTG